MWCNGGQTSSCAGDAELLSDFDLHLHGLGFAGRDIHGGFDEITLVDHWSGDSAGWSGSTAGQTSRLSARRSTHRGPRGRPPVRSGGTSTCSSLPGDPLRLLHPLSNVQMRKRGNACARRGTCERESLSRFFFFLCEGQTRDSLHGLLGGEETIGWLLLQ
jgi:hypothetical protein